VSRVLTALLFTVVMILAAYFLLAVIAYAEGMAQPFPRAAATHPRPAQPLPCVACVSLMMSRNGT